MVVSVGLLGLAALTGHLLGAESSAHAEASAEAAERRTPVSLGIMADGGHMAIVVPRHTALPVKRSRKFTSSGTVEVLASEHPLLKGSYRLGYLDLRPSIPRGARVSLSFQVDLGGLLTVTAEDEDTRQIAKAFFHNYRHMHRAFTREDIGVAWCALMYLREHLGASRTASIVGGNRTGDLRASLEDLALANSTQGDWSWSLDTVFGDPVDQGAAGAHDDGQAKVFPDVEWNQDFDLAFGVEVHSRALVGTTLAALSLAWILITQRGKALGKAAPASAEAAKVAELEECIQALSVALASRTRELEACRQQLRVAEELPFAVHDETTEQETARFIKVQCPGVTHDDVEIAIIFNGAVVAIDRKESELARALRWTKRFQFQLDEGHFEFKEDEARLEYGILNIVFRASKPQPRIFRFGSWHGEPSSPVLSSWTFAARQEDKLVESSSACLVAPSQCGWESADLLASTDSAVAGEQTESAQPPREQSGLQEEMSSLSRQGMEPSPPLPAHSNALSPLPTESSMHCAASPTASPRSSC